MTETFWRAHRKLGSNTLVTNTKVNNTQEPSNRLWHQLCKQVERQSDIWVCTWWRMENYRAPLLTLAFPWGFSFTREQICIRNKESNQTKIILVQNNHLKNKTNTKTIICEKVLRISLFLTLLILNRTKLEYIESIVANMPGRIVLLGL